MFRYTVLAETPGWGRLGVVVTPAGLVAVLWGEEAARAAPGLEGEADVPTFQALRCGASRWLAHVQAYLRGERRRFPMEIAWGVLPPFRRQVLRAVAAIPYGETRTYGQIAAAIGRPGAARAVGQAVAANPMPLVIPCHRVVGAKGKLHGFSGPGGAVTKARLLALERSVQEARQ